jgi:hypothetical protein
VVALQAAELAMLRAGQPLAIPTVSLPTAEQLWVWEPMQPLAEQRAALRNARASSPLPSAA